MQLLARVCIRAAQHVELAMPVQVTGWQDCLAASVTCAHSALSATKYQVRRVHADRINVDWQTPRLTISLADPRHIR